MKTRWLKICALAAIMLGALFLFAPKTAQAFACVSNATGSWNTAGTWTSCNSTTPQSGDTVTIATGHTVTLNTSATITSLSITGTLAFNDTTNRTLTVSSDVTVNSGGTISTANASGNQTHNLLIGGNFTNNGTVTLVNGNDQVDVTFNGTAAQSISGSSTTPFNVLIISNTSANVSATTNFNVNVSMTVNASATFVPDAGVVINSAAAAGTISGAGTIKVTRTAATADYSNQYKFSANTLSSMTVDYAGTGAQTINVFTYGSLLTSGSGTKTVSTVAGTLQINTAVTIGSGTTLDESTKTMSLAGATLAVNGTFDFTSSTGLVQCTSGTCTLTAGASSLIRTVDDLGLGPVTNASLVNNGGVWTTTSLSTSGTVEYNRTTAQTVTDRDYNNLTITNTGTKTWTLAASRTVNGNVTLNSSAPLTLSGTQTVNVKGIWTNNGTFTAGTSTIAFNGTGAQTIGGSNSTTFSGLTINNTGGSVTLNTSGTVSGLLTLTSDLTTGSNTLTQTGTCAGARDVIGTVARSDQGTTTRCFGNPDNQITFAGGAGTPTGTVTVRLVKSTPNGFTTGNVVARYYILTSNAWTGSGTTLQLRYLESELPSFTGGKTEADLVLYKFPPGGTKFIQQGGTVNTASNFVNLTGVSSLSDWAFAASGTPTASDLVAYSAKLTRANKVRVKWETGNELTVVGFNVWRATKRKATYKMLNTAMLDAKNAGGVQGATYAFKDKHTKSGKTYFYKLEVVKADGTSEWSSVVKVNTR